MASVVIAPTRIKQINNLYAKIGTAFKEMVETMIKLGDHLTQVKAELPHGTFMNWVNTNCEFSHRTATTYMTLFENKDFVFERLTSGSEATVTGILAMLPKGDDQEQEQEDSSKDNGNIVIRQTKYGSIWKQAAFEKEFAVKEHIAIANMDARIVTRKNDKTQIVAIFPAASGEVHIIDWEFIKRTTGLTKGVGL